jgi:hypothetical protein
VTPRRGVRARPSQSPVCPCRPAGCGVPAGDPRILRSALLCPSIDDWMAMIEAMPDEGMYNLPAPTPARTLA